MKKLSVILITVVTVLVLTFPVFADDLTEEPTQTTVPVTTQSTTKAITTTTAQDPTTQANTQATTVPVTEDDTQPYTDQVTSSDYDLEYIAQRMDYITVFLSIIVVGAMFFAVIYVLYRFFDLVISR